MVATPYQESRALLKRCQVTNRNEAWHNQLKFSSCIGYSIFKCNVFFRVYHDIVDSFNDSNIQIKQNFKIDEYHKKACQSHCQEIPTPVVHTSFPCNRITIEMFFFVVMNVWILKGHKNSNYVLLLREENPNVVVLLLKYFFPGIPMH